MGVNPAAYKQIMATNPADHIDGGVNVNVSAPIVRDAFRRAAKGEDVITRELTDTITNDKTYVSRTEFAPDNLVLIDDIFHIADAIERNGSALLPDSNSLEYALTIKNIADKSGLDKEVISQVFDGYAKLLKDSNYPESLAEYLKNNGRDVANRINEHASTAGGSYLPLPTSEKLIAVNQITDVNDVFGIKKPFPGTADQIEFFLSLHESHHSQNWHGVIDENGALEAKPNYELRDLSPTSFIAARELSADMALISFLNNAIEAGEPGALEQKEWWLQMRNVNSFREDLIHDSSTFIRIYEQTGQQVDLEKLMTEKRGLQLMIEERIQSGPASVDVDNIMGVINDILKNDSEKPDGQKLLSEVQRDQALMFLEDAKALGYEANPFYPKAKPQAPQLEAAPVAQNYSSTAPAWANTPAA